MKKVYAVLGGFDYEGSVSSSLKLFNSYEDAEIYVKYLVSIEGFDTAKIEECVIE